MEIRKSNNKITIKRENWKIEIVVTSHSAGGLFILPLLLYNKNYEHEKILKWTCRKERH